MSDSHAGLDVDSRGGDVLRIPGFDLRQAEVEWRLSKEIEMAREDGPDGAPCYRLTVKDDQTEEAEGDTRYRTGLAGARNTVRLLPNRNYIISALVECDFKRPVEINMGLRSVDSGGRCVMSQFRG
ncbi:MAG: hypothetical protein MUQ26_07905, partial [Armatimonadetes bacterium]|nr:hypothetical protein [Armatimonadota bacterium]